MPITVNGTKNAAIKYTQCFRFVSTKWPFEARSNTHTQFSGYAILIGEDDHKISSILCVLCSHAGFLFKCHRHGIHCLKYFHFHFILCARSIKFMCTRVNNGVDWRQSNNLLVWVSVFTIEWESLSTLNYCFVWQGAPAEVGLECAYVPVLPFAIHFGKTWKMFLTIRILFASAHFCRRPIFLWK